MNVKNKIQLIAYRGTGKDTFYKYMKLNRLNDLGYDCYIKDKMFLISYNEPIRVSFADRLKKDVSSMYNLDRHEMEKIKDKNLDIFGGKSYRDILIEVSTANKLLHGENYYLNLVKCKINKIIYNGNIPVITDTRFKNEIMKNSLTVRLFREEVPIPTHISERSMDNYQCDVLLTKGKINTKLYDNYYKVNINDVFDPCI